LDAIFLPYSLMHMYIYTYRSQWSDTLIA
jgi:hypothetical protein